MLKKLLWFSLILLLVLIFACAREKASVMLEDKKVPETAAVNFEKAGWEAEWERVLKEAKKEGKVIIRTFAASELRQAISEAFEKKYGISLVFMVGRAAELVQRILMERRAGIYDVDLWISGPGPLYYELKPVGALTTLEPLLILPEVKDPKLWYKGVLPFMDKDKLSLAFLAFPSGDFHINSNKVKAGEISNMQDLLSPKWKGKIMIDDPTVSGKGQVDMIKLTVLFGEEFLKKFAKQEIFITRDRRILGDWLVMGKYPVSLGLRGDDYKQYREAGAPISRVNPKDALNLSAGAGYLAYFDRAPHPNASRVFVNWLLSKEGQTIWQHLGDGQSARIDTPVDYFTKENILIRQPGIVYLDTISLEWLLETRPKFLPIVLEVFQPLVR